MRNLKYALLGLLCAPALAQRPELPFPMSSIGTDAGLEALLLQPDLVALGGLESLATVELTGFPLPSGTTVDLVLDRLSVQRHRFGLHLNGVPAPGIVEGLGLTVWKGTVEGAPDSDVMLGFSPHGCRGWVKLGQELVHVMPQPDDSGDWTQGHVVLMEEASLNERGFELRGDCETARQIPNGEPVFVNPGTDEPPLANMGSCSKVECSVAIECDTQLYDIFGDVNAATAYVTTLWTFIGDRYDTQANTILVHPYLNIPSNGSDPWVAQDNGGSSVDLLYEFQAAWVGNIPLNCRTAHFMSGASLGGGVAWLGVLCNNTYNFAVSGNINTGVSFPVVQAPTNWDFMVCAHELGHNFDSPHSHDFCPPLDECAPSGYFGQCQTQQVCTNQGTIMSYCHLCSGGTGNITTYFHPTAAARMTLHAAACLPSYVDASADAPTVMAPGVATPVTLTTTASPATPPQVWYAADGVSFTAIDMVPGAVGTWTADLPAAACGDLPAFYYTVTDPACGALTLPAGAPAAAYTAVVGTFSIAASDACEAPTGWTVGDSNDDATTGIWENASPQGTTAQPGEDHTPGAGTNCWVTGATAGASVGTNDIDGGTTTLYSPIYDLSGLTAPVVSYWRWYNNSAGSNPGQDSMEIEVSSDGGATWASLEVVGPTSDNTGGWILASHDLAAIVTPTSQVQLRFRASDLGGGSIVEAAIDDLEISEFSCGGGGPLGTRYCSPASQNSSGTSGTLDLAGSAVLADNDLTLEASGLPQNQFGLFVTSQTTGSATVGSGTLCVAGQIGRFSGPGQIQNSGASGSFSLAVDLTGGWPVAGVNAPAPGETWHFTTWFRDVGATSNFTDAVSLTFQ